MHFDDSALLCRRFNQFKNPTLIACYDIIEI